MNKKQDPSFWFGMFLGGFVGALILYLLGTKEGKKVTKEFEEEGEGFFAEIEKKLIEVEKKGSDFLEHAAESKDEIVETVVKGVDTTLSHIEKLQEHGRATTSQIRKRLFKNAPKK